MAAAVLAYVNAGLLILAGALLLFGASVVSDFENSTGSGSDYGVEIALDGLLNLVAAGLLIAGAVMFTSGKSTGRLLLTVGCAIVIAESVYWLTRFNSVITNSGTVVWALLFGVLAVLPLAFAYTGAVTRWIQGTHERG